MESKTYTYQEPYFTMEVKAEGAFCVLIFFACAWLIYTNAYNMWGLYVVFAVAALYQVWNTFVARCYSHSVTLSDDQISFELFGKSQSYKLSELKEFRVREYPSSGKMYLRVGDHRWPGALRSPSRPRVRDSPGHPQGTRAPYQRGVREDVRLRTS